MSSYWVEFKAPAVKDIKRLDGHNQKRILAKLRLFVAQDEPLTFAKHLADSREGSYRWRIGNFRVVFDVEGDVFVVLRVQHRREVYRQ